MLYRQTDFVRALMPVANVMAANLRAILSTTILGRTWRHFATGGLALALLASFGTFWFGGDNPPAMAMIGGPFQLIDGQGAPVTDRSFAGKYMLVYFGYTLCPDVCPTTLADVTAAMDELGAKAKQVQPIFITVDPKRDTAPVVQQYVAAFSPALVGLTGTPAQIATVAREYRVYYAEHRTGPGEYSIDHSSVLYLMGPNGKFIAPIRADQDAQALAADINRHLTLL